MSGTASGESPEKLSLKTLDQRLRRIEEAVAYLEADVREDEAQQVTEEMFLDLVTGVIETLVRARSQGAYRVAEVLRDKYLDPETDLQAFGEAMVTMSQLSRGNEA